MSGMSLSLVKAEFKKRGVSVKWEESISDGASNRCP